MAELFMRNNLLDSFKEQYWPLGLTPKGDSECRRCLKGKTQFDAFKSGTTPEAAIELEEEKDEQKDSDRFALESHLRDYIAKNPERLEPGLSLYSQGETEGVEFPVDDGWIDILCKDKDGKFVVIELKLSRGRNKALGQLLYYIGWVDKNFGGGPCRGIILANEITDHLATAVSRVPGVSLYNYRLNFSVEKVS